MADRQKTTGTSLAKGPAGLIGLLLLAYGITALFLGGHSFTQHVPNGTVHGKTWIGLEVNGWSDLLFIAGGLLLLFGSPLHWSAKGMSLLVGIVLGAAALVALATKERGVFGLLAANHLTELVWGAVGLLLIVLSLLPRVGGKTEQRDDRSRGARRPRPEPRGVGHSTREVAAREQPARADRERDSASATAPRTRIAHPPGANDQRRDGDHK